MLGLVGPIECTVGTQKRFPKLPRHTLVSYFSEPMSYVRCNRPVQASKICISLIPLFFRHSVYKHDGDNIQFHVPCLEVRPRRPSPLLLASRVSLKTLASLNIPDRAMWGRFVHGQCLNIPQHTSWPPQ